MARCKLTPIKTVSRAEILEKIWGYSQEESVDLRIVDVHISRLRANLENEPNHPELILTTRGIGYFFQKVLFNNA